MSAVAAGVAGALGEHADWRAEGVSVVEVVERLRELNREHALHEHGHAATRTLNLLVTAGDDVGDDELSAALSGIGSRHPSRTIVLREHDVDRLDARAAIDCDVREGSRLPGHCHDAVELLADAERLRHADSLARPLLVPGLPIVLWLPGAGSSPAEAPLAWRAQTIVLDARAGEDPAAAFLRAGRLTTEAAVQDLAWMRLARWRRRVAAAFELPQPRAVLAAVQRVEIRFCGPDVAAPLLLAGWLVARAGWTLLRMLGDGDRWSGEARRGDGEVVLVELGPPGGDRLLEGIHELAFHAPADDVRIVEPVPEADPIGTFGAALQRYDASAPGYAPALTAIIQGLAGS